MQAEKVKKDLAISANEKKDISALARCVVGLLKERRMTVTGQNPAQAG